MSKNLRGVPQAVSEDTMRLNPHLYPTYHAQMRAIGEKAPDAMVTARELDQAGVPPVRSRTPASEVMNSILQPSTDEQKLNKLERSWLVELRLLYPADSIGIQSITLKLADGVRYTPDFNVMDANGQLWFHETKGFMRDDARVKLRVAARMYRRFRFKLIMRRKGQWIEEEVQP